jgi:hypothetical protein
MPKIIGIKIIKGRRVEDIEEEIRKHSVMRKVTEVRYKDWKSKASRHHYAQAFNSIEYWAYTECREFMKLYEKPLSEYDIDLYERAGVTFPEKKPEVSIEQQMLDLIKDGWEPNGGLIVSDKEFCQTMVLYERPTPITEDLLSDNGTL